MLYQGQPLRRRVTPLANERACRAINPLPVSPLRSAPGASRAAALRTARATTGWCSTRSGGAGQGGRQGTRLCVLGCVFNVEGGMQSSLADRVQPEGDPLCCRTDSRSCDGARGEGRTAVLGVVARQHLAVIPLLGRVQIVAGYGGRCSTRSGGARGSGWSWCPAE